MSDCKNCPQLEKLADKIVNLKNRIIELEAREKELIRRVKDGK